MITLPPAQRRYLISFWIVISLSGGLLVGFLLWVVESPRSSSWGVVLAYVSILGGLLRPEALALPYRAWNRLARDFARCARILLLGICFFVIFVAVGRTGSSLKLTRSAPAESLWTPRKTLVPAAFRSQYAGTITESPKKGWILSLISWTIRSGNVWACCLIPFLVLLSALNTDQESDFSADIYTLF
jgi:Saxitoxin biosynthesis operon protein SxtJ